MRRYKHVLPPPHEETLECWCSPTLYQRCPEARILDGLDVCSPSCPQCLGRARVLPYTDALPHLVAHR